MRPSADEMNDFKDQIQAWKERPGGGDAVTLLFLSDDGLGAPEPSRNMFAEEFVAINLGRVYGLFPPPPGLRAHEGGIRADGVPAGEGKGFRNAWSHFDKAAGALLSDPFVMRAIQTARGKGAGPLKIARERAGYRNQPLDVDHAGAGLRAVRNGAHVDVDPETRGWKSLRGHTVPCTPLRWDKHSTLMVALNQSRPHSIGAGGYCNNWFISPLSPLDYRVYVAKTVRIFEHRARTHSPYLWVPLRTLLDGHAGACDDDKFSIILAAVIAFGLPPVLYASGKPVCCPPPYSPVPYKRFVEGGGQRPDPSTMTVEPIYQLNALDSYVSDGLLHRKILNAFQAVYDHLPDQNWVVETHECGSYDLQFPYESPLAADDGAGSGVTESALTQSALTESGSASSNDKDADGPTAKRPRVGGDDDGR